MCSRNNTAPGSSQFKRDRQVSDLADHVILGHGVYFYRATLCISAVFVVAWCLRSSVTLVHCIQTAEDIVKLPSRPGSLIILVFDPERRDIQRRTPSAGAQNTGGGKILRFSTEISRLSRKRYEIGPWLLWNVNRKS